MSKQQSLLVFVLALLCGILYSTNAAAAKNSEPSMVYDESAYTEATEKDMAKMHALYLKAYDKKASLGDREKAKREYLKIGKKLVREMHERIMMLDVKKGAALSHTDVLLSVHMMSMMVDMLATLQQEEWKDPTLLQ